jgi:hypothetical protein
MGLIKYAMGTGMFLIFSIAIFSFVMNFADDNNSAINLANDPDYVNLNNNNILSGDTLITDSNLSAEAFTTSTIDASTDATKAGGQFKVGVRGMYGITKNTLSSSFNKVFGGDSSGFGVIFSIIGALMLFVVGWYAYKAWKGDRD